MERIFISAGSGTSSSTVVGGTTEAMEIKLLRDIVVTELKSQHYEVLVVPDNFNEAQATDWIDGQSSRGGVAIEIHTDAASNPSARGATVFYIANNSDRKAHAELLLSALVRRIPQLPSRGAIPDTATGLGRLNFCRLKIPSLYLNVGFLTNSDDRALIRSHRQDIATGITDGLAAWSHAISSTSPPDSTYPPINVKVNGQSYPGRGILVNGNAYVPVDLTESLGIDLSKDPNIRRVTYRSVNYVRAIDLQGDRVTVSWDASSRTVNLVSNVPSGQIDRIMSNGRTTEVQLNGFLKANNQSAADEFPDIAQLYREEGPIEGVNYDIAFSQMCVETNFLRFGGDISANQNNFAGLADSTGAGSASFTSARLGVRAHIQHLKAYASLEPLKQQQVDPRFRFVTRGIAPLVEQLGGRWSADADYGNKILTVLKQLYKSAGIS
jgi:hypothetical protein